MNRSRVLAALAALLATVIVAGCASAPPQRVKTIRILETEHQDRTIVIVRARPAPERRCWKHGNHWHCRKR